jgi:L-lactate dehydrogenase complex protein LldF
VARRVVAPGATPSRTFQEEAAVTLRDSRLRRNLGNAVRVIRDKRARVVGELPDWAELRAAGAAVKDAALLELDSHLERLEAAVVERGGVVHWARDGDEANAVVVEVARSHGVESVVKVKSIATDEIGLNEALGAAGVRAIETDLAELIIQLADDRQSHILVPAIHKGRADIRAVFREHLGLPDLTDDPPALTEAARLYLRERFLDARMGVSGANFAVAETGTVSVFESEGNGRMCTTLPDVLVTVMGVEKVVPAWRDMEVFLQLLPRSSTGERMNPYTSMWSGAGDGDGPSEFHLVLLDNGRSDALADDVGRQALRCIRCSACLNVCPVYARAGGHAYGSVYPGPIGAILTPQLVGMEGAAASLPFASSLCGACADVCPVEIDIPEVLVHLRARAPEPLGERLSMQAMAKVFSSRRAYERAQRVARLAQKPLVRGGVIPRAPGPLAAWTSVRDLPPVAKQTFREWWRADRGDGEAAHPPPEPPLPGHGAAAAPPPSPSRPSGADPSDPPSPPTPASRAPKEVASPSPALSPPAASASPRDEILERLRRAVRGAPPPPEIRRDYRLTDSSSRDVLADRFAERVSGYQASVFRASAGDLLDVLARACSEAGASRLAVPADLPPGWRPDGVELVEDRGLPPRELDAIDGALTGAALGIAETGTVVLDGGPGQGRRALTLVPDYHLCVVPEDRVVGLVPEAVGALATAAREGRPLTFVSGPSATSDIELDRVEGVHGPRTLHVVVLAQ